MNKLDGIQLMQKIRNGKVKDGSKIKVSYDDGMFDESYVTVIEYKNNDIIWAPSTFKVSMLYDSYYRFEIIEDNDKLEKIPYEFNLGYINTNDKDLVIKEMNKTINGIYVDINKVIDHINKIEEKLDER